MMNTTKLIGALAVLCAHAVYASHPPKDLPKFTAPQETQEIVSTSFKLEVYKSLTECEKNCSSKKCNAVGEKRDTFVCSLGLF